MKIGNIDNEEASAYTWLWVFIIIGLSAILYIAFTPSVAYLVDTTNSMATDGDISAQTLATMEFNVKMFTFYPVILIIGALGYVYLASVNEKRRSGGI